MLAGTGFRVVPDLLPLPDLPQSERRVPPWVLSSVVLTRLQALLDSLQRRFVIASGDLRAPRGQVDWGRYATTRFAHGRALDVPCRYPELRDDEELRSAVHWVVRRHRDALLGQTSAGLVVRRLLALCDLLLARLSGTQARMPAAPQRQGWSRRSIRSGVFREGLQAIDWTVDERGLAGLSDLAGLAWRMDMEVFFEAWVEAVAEGAARRVGARLRAGRRHETRVPLDWNPPASGSQRSLVPDLVLDRPDVVVVLDAKYKRHAEEIERLGWSNADERLREQHRNDVLQALAYSTLFNAPRVVACLVYPASPSTWLQLAARGRIAMRARASGPALETSSWPSWPSRCLETATRPEGRSSACSSSRRDAGRPNGRSRSAYAWAPDSGGHVGTKVSSPRIVEHGQARGGSDPSRATGSSTQPLACNSPGRRAVARSRGSSVLRSRESVPGAFVLALTLALAAIGECSGCYRRDLPGQSRAGGVVRVRGFA